MICKTSTTRSVVFAALSLCLVAAANVSPARAQFQPPRLGANNPLVMLITSEIAPKRWENMGGRGSIQCVDAWGLIFVTQTKEVHHEIEDLLAVVREARSQQAAAAPAAPAAPEAPFGGAAGNDQPNQQDDATSLVIKSASTSAARKHIDDEFITVTSLDFNNTPLSEVAETIGRQHGIKVVLDTQALEAAGITPDLPVTRKLEGVPLGTALWLLLGDLHLSYVVRDDVLHITTPAEAESLITRVYNVQDLIR